jgi:amino acid transporter
MFTISESERKGVHLDLSSECFLGTTPKNLGLGMLGVLWAYSGYNSVCALSEEFVNPKRDLPIGVSSGMAVVIILYVLSN